MGPLLALLLLQAASAERPLDRLLAPLRGERVPVQAGTRRDMEQVVADGYPRFDADGDGRIDRREFGRWMAALTLGAAEGATAEVGWTARAFEQADGDASGALSRAELADFLVETVSWRLPEGSPAR